MHLLPLTMDRIDWQSWNALRRTHNRDPVTRTLDQAGVKPDHPIALITALASTQDHVLRVCTLGFLVIPDADIAPHTLVGWLQAECEFPLIATEDGVLVKGSFYHIREFILRGSTETARPTVRTVANLIFDTLYKSGFKSLLEGYKRRSITDGTFVLCK